MLKPIHRNENNPTSSNKIFKKSIKQENKNHNSVQSPELKSPSINRMSIFQSSSKNTPSTDQTYRYQLLSAESNTIILKKIRTIPVLFY
jgi:hypothetical protein